MLYVTDEDRFDIHDSVGVAQAKASLQDSDDPDVFSSLIAASLDAAVNKAVDEIRTPQERFASALRIVMAASEGKDLGSVDDDHVKRMLDALIDAGETLTWASGVDARTAFDRVIAAESDISAYAAHSLTDVFGVQNMAAALLYAVVYAPRPMDTLNAVRTYRIIDTHRTAGTFEHLAQSRRLIRHLRGEHFRAYHNALMSPRLGLWRSMYDARVDDNTLLFLVQGGGRLSDLAVECNAANIVKANRILARLITQYEDVNEK
jgi:rRNA maturation endonuclease Nob1